MIRAEGLSVIRNHAGSEEISALTEVTVRLEPGELGVVLGRSGAGKTTLLEALAGLVEISGGRVCLESDGTVWSWAQGSPAPSEARRRIGLLFQYPERQIFGRTATEDVSWGLGERRGDLVEEALDRVEIPSRLRTAPLVRLSRGEKRRVALAGVLARAPDVLLLDEPSAGLDPAGQALLWSEVEAYRSDRRAAVWVATHWPETFLPRADRIVCLDRGTVRFCGSSRDLMVAVRSDRQLEELMPTITRLRIALEAGHLSQSGLAEWAQRALSWLRTRDDPADESLSLPSIPARAS